MTKIDHLWDASGLLAEKVAVTAAVVILTYNPVVEDDYSPALTIFATLRDRRLNRSSIYNIEQEHIMD